MAVPVMFLPTPGIQGFKKNHPLQLNNISLILLKISMDGKSETFRNIKLFQF